MAIVTNSINLDVDGNYNIPESIQQDLNFSIETGIIDNNLASALYSMDHVTSHYTAQGKQFSDFLSENFNQLGKGFSYFFDSGVDLGWSPTMQNGGKLSLGNIGGRAGSEYDEWSLNDTVNGIWSLDASLFDADAPRWDFSTISGDGTSAPEYSLGFGPLKNDYFLGTASTFQSFGSAQEFQTYSIPEPATTAGLLGAVALAVVSAKILRKKLTA